MAAHMRRPPALQYTGAEKQTLVVRMRGNEQDISRIADCMRHQTRIARKKAAQQDIQENGEAEEGDEQARPPAADGSPAEMHSAGEDLGPWHARWELN